MKMISLKIALLAFSSLISQKSFGYELLTIAVSDINERLLDSKDVSSDQKKTITLKIPNTRWECDAVKTAGYSKITKQDYIGVIIRCYAGSSFFSEDIICATEKSAIPGAGWMVSWFNTKQIIIGESKKMFTLTLACSTKSSEMIKAIANEK